MALAASVANAATTWTWKGGTDLNWFTPSNWQDASGNEATALASGDSFTFDAVTPSGAVNYNPSGNFSIGTITFGTGLTAGVKITGGKITSLGSAVNNNTSRAMEFANEVQFASTINLTMPTKHIIMSGGATGTTLSTSFSNLYGNFTLTSDWTVGTSYTVKEGSTLTTKNITNNASNSYLMIVDVKGKLVVNGNFSCYSSAKGASPRLLHKVNGVVIVTGTATVKGNSGDPGKNTCLVYDSSSSGIVLANKFSFQYGVKGTNYHYYNIAKIGVGTGNITYNNSARNYPKEYYSIGNWTFGEMSSNGNALSYSNDSIIFHTTDYSNSTVGRTITATACFDNKYVASGNKPVIVDGCGKMVFNCDFYRFYGLGASGSVTIEINNNCKPCNEASTNITMKSGTTLSFPKAGTGTTKEMCPIVIQSGAKMSFSNLSSTVVPVSARGLTLPASSPVPLTVAGSVLADGVYRLVSLTSGTIPDSYTNFVVSGTAIGTKTARAFRSSDKKLLLLGVDDSAETTDTCIWTGEGDGVNFSNPGNWMNGNVPSNGGEKVFFPGASGTLVNDIADAAPASITFAIGCSSAVKINGNAISGITAITNLSSASHTINAPVYFASGINVKQNAIAYDTIGNSHVTFAGGAYAAAGKTIDSGYSVVVFGKYYFANTSGSPWTATEDAAGTRKAVAANSYLYVPFAGNMNNLHVGSGAKIEIGNLAHGVSNGRLSWRNLGEMVVTNMTFTGSGNRYVSAYQDNNVTGKFKFESVVSTMTGNWFYFGDSAQAARHEFYIGAGGLSLSGYSQSQTPCFCFGSNFDGHAVTIRPWYSDFTIGDRTNGVYSLVFYRNVTLCTDDESGTGRTIKIDARTRSDGDKVVLTVSGSGKVEVNKTCSNSTAPTVAVTNTATLAIKPGASLGEGAMTVNSGATLAVPGAGTVTLDGNLTLVGGANLSFMIDGIGDSPKISMASGRTVNVSDVTAQNPVKVAIVESADKNFRSFEPYVLIRGAGLSGGDAEKFAVAENPPAWFDGFAVVGGDLVLVAKRPGLSLSVR